VQRPANIFFMTVDEQINSDLRATLSRRAGESPPTASMVEQYAAYLLSLDRIGDRRQSANSFFLSINTGLCALMGYMVTKDVPEHLRLLLWVIPFTGFLVSYFWFRLVRAYRYLNTAKFQVIEAMEEHLLLAPFSAEWVALQRKSGERKYVPLTALEVWIPRFFILLYGSVVFLLVPWHDAFSFLR
jgi:hypothetical protein